MARTDLAKIEADLAERAKDLREQIGSAESRRITVDQKEGAFVGPGNLALGDELRIIVVDFCTVNRYYDRPYDGSNPQPPACIAIGDKILEMVPEEGVPARQSPMCKDCWANQWQSDARGKGKACKNSRELAIVLADDLEDPDVEPELFVLSCAPTAIKSFDAAAGKIYQLYNSTPIKAIMTMKAQATENYYTPQFGGIEPNPYLERVFPLLADTADLLGRLPDFSTYEEPRNYPPGDVRNGQARSAPARAPAKRAVRR